MKNFNVRVIETLTKVVSIEAESEEEAISEANSMYERCDIILTEEDRYDAPEFEIDRTSDDDI